MPTLRTGTANNGDLLAAIGGSVAANDKIHIEGDIHYTSGEDLSAAEADLVVLHDPSQGFGKGTSLIVDLSGTTSELVMMSSRPWYVKGGGTGGEIQTATVLSAPRGIYFTGGTVPLLEQKEGTSYVESGCDAQTIRLAGGQLDVATHASDTIDNLSMEGQSSAYIKRSIGTLCTVAKGCWLKTAERSLTLEEIHCAGRWDVNNGDVQDAHLLPGCEINLSTLEDDMEFVSLTVWPGVKVIGDVPPGINVDWTSVTFVAGGSPGPWGTP